MNAEQREQFRLTLLRLLGTNVTEYGLPLSVLLMLARMQGHPQVELDAIRAELLYLQEAGLVTKPDKLISPELGAWRISKAGRDHLAVLGID